MTNGYLMGLDPAQLKDWSALAVVKRQWQEDKKENLYQLVALDRKQALPYNEIVDWVIKVFKNPTFGKWDPRADGSGITENPELILDTTGIGRALWDLFRAQGVHSIGATITGGSGLGAESGTYTVGKSLLLGRFLAAFDAGRVLVNPLLPTWPLLERELVNYRAKISAAGNAQFEAAPGEHDDLLFSLALCVWWGEEARKY